MEKITLSPEEIQIASEYAADAVVRAWRRNPKSEGIHEAAVIMMKLGKLARRLDQVGLDVLEFHDPELTGKGGAL